MADIPAGTGLGSSGSFAVGRVAGAPRAPARDRVERRARRARRAPSRSTGSASRSGSRTSTSPRSAASRRSSSTPTARSRCAPVELAPSTRHQLEDNLLLFFTGVRRSASDILAVETDGADGDRRRRSRRQPRRGEGARARDRGALGPAISTGSATLLTAAVGAEVRAVAHAGARRGRRLDPRRHRRRRGRRQARRCGRRRVPALLRGGEDRRCRARWPRSGWRRCASASTTRAPPTIVAQ